MVHIKCGFENIIKKKWHQRTHLNKSQLWKISLTRCQMWNVSNSIDCVLCLPATKTATKSTRWKGEFHTFNQKRKKKNRPENCPCSRLHFCIIMENRNRLSLSSVCSKVPQQFDHSNWLALCNPWLFHSLWESSKIIDSFFVCVCVRIYCCVSSTVVV